MPYAMYLRKSRADLDAEARGEGETLSRHKKALFSLAARLRLDVDCVYQEIVSGDTIEARPEMQRLLSDVAARKFDGVLVMEVERLARGDTRDQGTVAQVFKFSHTKIITPMKTYDPQNDADEEYFEFALFMSRREYSTIKRRLQAGRIASVRDGRYMGTRDPFGYRRVKIRGEKGYTLEVIPEQAELVRMMYRMYVDEHTGASTIANLLNDTQVPTWSGTLWDGGRVRSLLRNPLYAGFVQWNQRVSTKKMVDGRIISTRDRNPDQYLLIKGLHEPIIDAAMWERAKLRFLENAPRTPRKQTLSNPLAGLLRCGCCGRMMVLSSYTHVIAGQRIVSYCVKCVRPGCPTTQISFDLVERAVLDSLRGWVKAYSSSVAPPAPREDTHAAQRAALSSQLEKLEKQREKQYDLLEQGVYTSEVFTERLSRVNASIQAAKEALSNLPDASAPTQEDVIRALLPQCVNVLNAYGTASPAEKNALLRSVIDRIVYHKTHRCFRNENPADFLELMVYPKIIDNMR